MFFLWPLNIFTYDYQPENEIFTIYNLQYIHYILYCYIIKSLDKKKYDETQPFYRPSFFFSGGFRLVSFFIKYKSLDSLNDDKKAINYDKSGSTLKKNNERLLRLLSMMFFD